MEILLMFFGSVLSLLVVCFLGTIVLVKNTKEFHVHFGIFKGFDMSGSFYEDKDNNEEEK